MHEDELVGSIPESLQNSTLIHSLWKNYFKSTEELNQFYLHSGLLKDDSISKKLSGGDYSFTSSGTSGNPTKVYFSRTDAIEQQRNLIRLMKPFVPSQRDSAIICVNVDPHKTSARLAAARGFSLLASKSFYVYESAEDIYQKILECSEKYQHLILFSFTYDLFVLMKRLEALSLKNEFKNTISVIHGGGWKKNESESITPEDRNTLIRKIIPGCAIINYYGMVEQLGNVYPTCELGYHHTSRNNDVIVRNKYLQESPLGEEGIIQTIMKLDDLKYNYSILTEDIGKIITDKCQCGRPGKAFVIKGRITTSEVRGCSNAYF